MDPAEVIRTLRDLSERKINLTKELRDITEALKNEHERRIREKKEEIKKREDEEKSRMQEELDKRVKEAEQEIQKFKKELEDDKDVKDKEIEKLDQERERMEKERHDVAKKGLADTITRKKEGCQQEKSRNDELDESRRAGRRQLEEHVGEIRRGGLQMIGVMSAIENAADQNERDISLEGCSRRIRSTCASLAEDSNALLTKVNVWLGDKTKATNLSILYERYAESEKKLEKGVQEAIDQLGQISQPDASIIAYSAHINEIKSLLDCFENPQHHTISPYRAGEPRYYLRE
ncbi:unnamed protein product [Caenorhabditis auriculariae]|uniref:Uncharacterized protein n=1 Tax=Caenorhabditis auriculariae TaxID=2777116 RepID=A0A8S1HCZ5_9PELO|nr:unnamed protein product [Caenorhabditis auriculariae]